MEYENYPTIELKDDPLVASEPNDSDPFAKSWEYIRLLDGLDNNFKRRSDRLSKAQPTKAYEEASMMQPRGAGAVSQQINPGKLSYVNGYGAFDVITPPYNLYVLSGFFDTSFANHAAINAKVASSVGTGYSLQLTNKAKQSLQDTSSKDKQSKASKKLDRVKLNVQDWLEKLNDQDSFTDTMRKIVTDLEATGNAYLEVGRTVRGEIGYLGHIPSTTMRVRRLKDGYVQIVANAVVYFRNFGAENVNPITGDSAPNEVIHFKKYSPLNSYYGVPNIVSASTSVVGDQQADQYNLEYFENKAVPRYVITLKGAKLSAQAEQKLFRFFQTQMKGQHHRTLYVPLPPDAEGNKVEFNMEPVENKIQDASFDNYRKNNRANILLAHGVPLTKLGVAEDSGVAAAVTQDRTFRDNIIRPLQGYLEKLVNRVIEEVSELVFLKFNEGSVVDETEQAKIHETYLVNNVIKPNEVREELGRPAIEGLDEEEERKEAERFEREQNAAREAAEQKAEHDRTSRDARDRSRDQNASDSSTTTTGRNPKGSGAKE